MWDGKPWHIDRPAPHREDVEIQRARCPLRIPPRPPRRLLNLVTHVEELHRSQRRLYLDDSVQVRGRRCIRIQRMGLRFVDR